VFPFFKTGMKWVSVGSSDDDGGGIRGTLHDC
jgi:hypothetical protein